MHKQQHSVSSQARHTGSAELRAKLQIICELSAVYSSSKTRVPPSFPPTAGRQCPPRPSALRAPSRRCAPPIHMAMGGHGSWRAAACRRPGFLNLSQMRVEIARRQAGSLAPGGKLVVLLNDRKRFQKSIRLVVNPRVVVETFFKTVDGTEGNNIDDADKNQSYAENGTEGCSTETRGTD